MSAHILTDSEQHWCSLGFAEVALALVRLAFFTDLHLSDFKGRGAHSRTSRDVASDSRWSVETDPAAADDWFAVLLVDWTADNEDWNHSKELLLNGPASPCPVNHLPPYLCR